MRLEDVILKIDEGTSFIEELTPNYEKHIKELVKAINAYRLAELPKEKHVNHKSPEFVDNNPEAMYGYNQAIADIRRIIENE